MVLFHLVVRLLAELGYAPAQAELGAAYLIGEMGLPKEPSLAVEWFRKAASQGHVASQSVLGYLYDQGVLGARDRQNALHWYQQAAERGDAVAQSWLGMACDDPAEQLAWFRRAADRGYAPAQLVVGLLYTCDRGAIEDRGRAASWLRKAAVGATDPEDSARALNELWVSAQVGRPEAQTELGRMYWAGECVPRDWALAMEWFSRAAERGYAPALSAINARRTRYVAQAQRAFDQGFDRRPLPHSPPFQ